ncbi:MAG TPA: Rho termination factor N-terminal domain-containing protein [Thermoleophilaceae bacterium]|jgi:transcription termination factor Rho
MSILDRAELERSPLADLHAIASELGIEGYRALRRDDLIEALLAQGGGESGSAGNGGSRRDGGSSGGDADAASAADAGRAEEAEADVEPERDAGSAGERSRAAEAEVDAPPPEAAQRRAAPDEDAERRSAPEEVRTGVLDVLPNGSGFMRPDPFVHSRDDVHVSPAQIRRCGLRSGDEISGPVRAPRRSERYPSLVRVETVNGASADPPPERPRFEDLTPVFASERLTAPDELAAVPFGRGSRVAVGGPPGSGITTLLRRIALTLASSHPDVELAVVLAGVRPEEVTEWRRDSAIPVVGGGFDRSVDDQAQAAEIAVERAKRAAEGGRHAAIVLDSLDALPPATARRVFGAARALEEGGSLTVVASTGLAGEPQRLATTRIVLEPPAAAGSGPRPPALAPGSGTLRADRLT